MDIVYTYVNSSDINWQEKYKINKLLYFNESINNIDSNTNNRFQDNGELKYSIRSVEKYLKFVRNIYIVTDNQIPYFLNNNSKIKIIDHKDIIPNEYLPTFNSHVIELYLHKIPNLSSPFMYLNDDIIFTKELTIDDFIYNYKKFYVFLDPKNYTKKGIPITTEYAFRSAWKNSNKWLDDNFKIENRLKMQHAPMIIFKNIIYDLFSYESLYNKIIETSKNKFRSINDINLLCSIYIYYCLYLNKAINNTHIICKSIFSDIINDDIQLYNILTNCENDYDNYNSISILCVNEFNKKIEKFLNKKFPTKSKFEI